MTTISENFFKFLLRFSSILFLVLFISAACSATKDFTTQESVSLAEKPAIEQPKLQNSLPKTSSPLSRAELLSPPVVLQSPPIFQVETITEELEVPWSIEFLPDGAMLVAERPGRLRMIQDGQLDPQPIPGLPLITAVGEGGLMDIALHPQFEQNQWLYLSYTATSEEGDIRTRVSRFRLTDGELTEPQAIFAGAPSHSAGVHFGSRLAFGLDGKLYITLGERADPSRAQDLQDLNGKTLRLNEDGTIPDDNPFVGRADARPEIFSFGHRNAQGIAVQPGTGSIFQTEHGPSGYDGPRGGEEINLVEKGRNYGWPEISYNQRGPGMLAPLILYNEVLAPAGATFYTGNAFPDWYGDFFFANLRDQSLIRLDFDESHNIVGQEKLLHRQYGRLRDVVEGPDGFLYVSTSDNDTYGAGRAGGDRIIRLIPNS